MSDLDVILLHDGMVDKTGSAITASLTLIDIHDIARSARTYGVRTVYVAHSSPAMRKLARTIKTHWEEGFGATYNPNRAEALAAVTVVADLDEALHDIEMRDGRLPTLVATSARGGGERIDFPAFARRLETSADSFLLMLGTGWGMGEALLARATLFL